MPWLRPAYGGPMDDFAGREGVAFVTGGTGGLGLAVVQMLAARGSDIAFTYRSNVDAAAALVGEVEAVGRRAISLAVDLTDVESVEAAVESAAELGGIHTFVHAAGPVIPQIHLSRIEPELLHQHMRVEVDGFFNVVHALIPHLRLSQGALVAITTAATKRYPVRDGLSPVAKGAVEQMVWGIAAEEGRFGIRANCVGPGMTDAGMAMALDASGDLSERDYEAARANIPMRSFGTAADIAEAVCFLASPRANYISGQHLSVDGGYSV